MMETWSRSPQPASRISRRHKREGREWRLPIVLTVLMLTGCAAVYSWFWGGHRPTTLTYSQSMGVLLDQSQPSNRRLSAVGTLGHSVRDVVYEFRVLLEDPDTPQDVSCALRAMLGRIDRMPSEPMASSWKKGRVR